MKAIRVFFATLLMSALIVSTAFAGGWHSDSSARWWYVNDDGSYLKDGWFWVNDRSYCFDTEGYMYSNCVTPDGYTVDDTGAWTVNGVVQERPTTVVLNTMQMTLPNGYEYGYVDEAAWAVTSGDSGVHVVISVVPDLEARTLQEGVDGSNATLVKEYLRATGTVEMISHEYKDYPSGSWYHAICSNQNDVYLRAIGNIVEYIHVFGHQPEFTPDQFMTYYIR